MVTPKNPLLPTLVSHASVRDTIPAVLQFPVSLRGHVARSDSGQDHHRAVSASLRPPRDWKRPRGRPRRLPPGWGGLMPMYSRQTSVSTQLGGSPTIMFSGDVSSTRQHSITDTKRRLMPPKSHDPETGARNWRQKTGVDFWSRFSWICYWQYLF